MELEDTLTSEKKNRNGFSKTAVSGMGCRSKPTAHLSSRPYTKGVSTE